jgi:hypothetical protein
MTATLRRAARTLLAGAVSLAILGGMIVLHAWPLWRGQEIVLPVVPRDPRDPFYGEYVRLDTPATRLSIGGPVAGGSAVVVAPAGTWWTDLGDDAVAQSRALRGKVVFVQFEARGGEHQAVSISGRPVAGALNLRGRVRWFDAGTRRLTVDYGLSRYYVQEGTAKPIEDALTQHKQVQMQVAVTSSGRARIRRVIVDGVER